MRAISSRTMSIAHVRPSAANYRSVRMANAPSRGQAAILMTDSKEVF